MRVFLLEHPHTAFNEVSYNGEISIDIEVDVLESEIYIGEERNPKNKANYINPVLDFKDSAYLKNGILENNTLLIVDVLKKILFDHYKNSGDGVSFSIAITEMLVSVVFELGVQDQILDLVQSHLKEEAFLNVSCEMAKADYFKALPVQSKPTILVKSIDDDLYYLYEASGVFKCVPLLGLAKDPLVGAVMDEMFKYIRQTNGHLHLDFKNERGTLYGHAEAFLKSGMPFDLGDLTLSNGISVGWQVTLANAKSIAEQASGSGLIVRQISTIALEMNEEANNLKLFYSGENIKSENFQSLFRQKVSDIEYIQDDFALDVFKLNGLEYRKVYQNNSRSGIGSSESNKKEQLKESPLRTSSPVVGDSGKKSAAPPHFTDTTAGSGIKANTPAAPPVVPNSSAAPSSPRIRGSHSKDDTKPKTGGTPPTKSRNTKSPPPPPPPPPKIRGVRSKVESKAKTGSIPPANQRNKKSPPPPPPPPPPKLKTKPPVSQAGAIKVNNGVKRPAPPPPPPPPPPKKK